MNPAKRVCGFTLVELLIVIAVIAALSSIGVFSFQSAQVKSRDAKRKSDLRQIATALETYKADYGVYPASDTGQIMACPMDPATQATVCEWGSGEFSDTKTKYMGLVPADPSSNQNYYYVALGNFKKYQLYARLEYSQDPSCLDNDDGDPDCANPKTLPSAATCGQGLPCNYAQTSSNTNPFEADTRDGGGGGLIGPPIIIP